MITCVCTAVSDGQAHQAVGDEEDCGVHRGGGAHADRLHLPEGGGPQPPAEHPERRGHGQYNRLRSSRTRISLISGKSTAMEIRSKKVR